MSAPSELPPQVFRQAVEQSALAISITDERANILYANPAFERVTGYAHSEVAGHNESILSYKVTPKLVYETLWAQLKRQRAWNGLLVNRRRDGSRYLADVTITPVVDADGRTSHFLGMHRDVTEMHRLERQVQNQKAMIESVVDAAQVAICLLDEDDRVVLDNQEYKKLIGDLDREPAATLLAALLLGIFPGIIDTLGAKLGVAYPPTLLLIFGIAALLIKILTMDIEHSRQERSLRRLAQRIAIVEAEFHDRDKP